MYFLKYLTFTIFFLISSNEAFAYDTVITVGNICEFIGRIQVDEAGSSNFCNFNPYLGASFNFAPFQESFLISPEIGSTLPRSGRDSNILKMNLFALVNARYKFTYLDTFVGTGLYFTRIEGGGGEVALNNGNSTTSFPLPDSTVYSRNFILNLGIGYHFTPSWGVDFHTYLFNLLESEDRAMTLLLNVNYQLGIL